jgi:hypothetical protein
VSLDHAALLARLAEKEGEYFCLENILFAADQKFCSSGD